MYLKQNLKYLRESRGLLQEDIAQIANVGQKAVSAWELEKTVPPIETIVRLAEYFGATLDELVLKDMKPPIPMYARNIRYLRGKAGLKQSEIAELIKVSKANMSKIESGEIGVSVENLERISDFFGVTLDQMVKQDLSKE